MTELYIAGGTEYDISDMRVAIIPEGCLVGTPAVMIRLEQEPDDLRRRRFIDIKERFTTGYVDIGLWARTNADEIGKAARAVAGRTIHWATIVAAFDPAKVKLKALVDSLHRYGLYVAIETGGEYDGVAGAGADWVTIVNPNFKAIFATLAEAHECRFTMIDDEQATAMAQFNATNAQHLGAARRDGHVERTISPGDSNGSVDFCVWLAKTSGYRLSGHVPSGALP